MKYRKKPVVIEAYQTDKELDIETLEGTMHASAGDYIITGVCGEQYPCKPDIFKQTYEPADTPTISAVPVVHGEWKTGIDANGDPVIYCSNCKMPNYVQTNYCPDCGVRMRGEHDED